MKKIIGEYWKVNKLLLVLHVLINIFSGSLIIAEVELTAAFIDALKNINKNSNTPFLYFFIFLLCLFFQEIIAAISSVIQRKLHYEINEDLQYMVILKRAKLQYEYIEDESTLNLIHRVGNNIVKNYEDGYKNIISVVYILVRIISVLFIFIKYNIFWTVFACIVCLIMILFAKRYGHESNVLEKEILQDTRKLRAFDEMLSTREAASERYIFSFCHQIISEWEKLFCSTSSKKIFLSKKWMVRIKGAGIFIYSTLFIVVLSFLPAIAEQKISVGFFIALFNAVVELHREITWNLTETVDSITYILEYIKDEDKFWHLADETVKEGLLNISEFKSLEFKNVTFTYPNCKSKILANLSFVIDSGRSYALVGANGAGKSTVIKLILGLYEDYEGEILINGIDINRFNMNARRNIIGIIFQDYAKYNLTIKENIKIGLRGKNVQDLNGVLNRVGLRESIMKLPNGEEEILGKLDDGGIDLSGGEWQRIAIARGIISESPLLIMDEPTAALDPIQESGVYEQFSELIKQKTSIIISHRMGVTKLVDQILVLDQGKLVESGTYDELMMKEGYFFQMYESQRRWYCED